jgi:hypothetical protein
MWAMTTMSLRPALRPLALAICLTFAATSTRAEDWPPADPGEAMAKVEFTSAWASHLRGIRSFRELQDAAGARGKITHVVLDGDSPHVIYGWSGAANRGRMRAFLYESGGFGAIITPAGDAREIVLNSFDAFVCGSCVPPVNACGHRPSWVPHDLHWDVFDCGCTLTGPQNLHSGPC